MDDFRNDDPQNMHKAFPASHRGIETITYVLKGQAEHADCWAIAVPDGDAMDDSRFRYYPSGNARGECSRGNAWFPALGKFAVGSENVHPDIRISNQRI